MVDLTAVLVPLMLLHSPRSAHHNGDRRGRYEGPSAKAMHSLDGLSQVCGPIDAIDFRLRRSYKNSESPGGRRDFFIVIAKHDLQPYGRRKKVGKVDRAKYQGRIIAKRRQITTC